MHDEQAALALGLVGQETVGPGGFAMAVRTIPPLVAYAREVMRRAPEAWIVNFTNPAGMVTQALIAETGARVIGICDTPTEVFQEVAHALSVPAAECRFDYIGLNHLGFIREVWWRDSRSWNGSGTIPPPWRGSTGRRSSLRRGCAGCACCRPSTSSTTSHPSGP